MPARLRACPLPSQPTSASATRMWARLASSLMSGLGGAAGPASPALAAHLRVLEAQERRRGAAAGDSHAVRPSMVRSMARRGGEGVRALPCRVRVRVCPQPIPGLYNSNWLTRLLIHPRAALRTGRHLPHPSPAHQRSSAGRLVRASGSHGGFDLERGVCFARQRQISGLPVGAWPRQCSNSSSRATLQLAAANPCNLLLQLVCSN